MYFLLAAEVDELIKFGQGYLWDEWMKVKQEVKNGDPYS